MFNEARGGDPRFRVGVGVGVGVGVVGYCASQCFFFSALCSAP